MKFLQGRDRILSGRESMQRILLRGSKGGNRREGVIYLPRKKKILRKEECDCRIERAENHGGAFYAENRKKFVSCLSRSRGKNGGGGTAGGDLSGRKKGEKQNREGGGKRLAPIADLWRVMDRGATN